MQLGLLWIGLVGQAGGGSDGLRSFFDQVLTFLYTAAHWLGQVVENIVQAIVGYALPTDLIDPIGFLILLTIFLAISEIAKRLAWVIVVAGWVLIVIRIVLEVLRTHG